MGGVIRSLALVADAGHMLVDSVSLGLAWYAFHLSTRTATARLTYGFDRVKTLVAYTNGLTVFVIGAWIVYEAWHRLSDPSPVLGGPMLGVAIIGLVVNIVAFFVLHGGDRESLNMRGAILHVLGDLLGSVAAIAAALVILATGGIVDRSVGAGRLLLFRSARCSCVIRPHAAGGRARQRHRGDVSTVSCRTSGVSDIHHVHVWSMDGSAISRRCMPVLKRAPNRPMPFAPSSIVSRTRTGSAMRRSRRSMAHARTITRRRTRMRIRPLSGADEWLDG